MKFEITENQGLALRELQEEESAASLTLKVAMSHHSSLMRQIATTTELVWSEIVDTHELDITTHDYQLIEEAGKFFVISSKPEKA